MHLRGRPLVVNTGPQPNTLHRIGILARNAGHRERLAEPVRMFGLVSGIPGAKSSDGEPRFQPQQLGGGSTSLFQVTGERERNRQNAMRRGEHSVEAQ